MRGTEREVDGTISATISWKTLKARSMVIPRSKIFCDKIPIDRWHFNDFLPRDTLALVSGGRANVKTAREEMRAHGMMRFEP